MRHAPGSGDVAQRRADQAAVSGIFLKAGFEVEANFLLALEVFHHVPFLQLDAHDVLLKLRCQCQRFPDVPCLRRFDPSSQEDDDFQTALDEVEPIAWPIVNSHFGNPLAH